MNRKTFLRRSLFLALGVGATAFRPLPVLARRSKTYSLTLLYTANLNGRVESKDSGFDMARLKTLVDQVRKEQPNTLLLDCGNALGPTAYAEMYGTGFMYGIMSKMQYDAGLLGPDDWRVGAENLLNALAEADFPVICSNYAMEDSGLKDRVLSHYIIQAGPVKVGLFGLDPDIESPGKIRYRRPDLIAQAMVRSLKGYYECDLAVCLSQLDVEADRKLARAVPGVDIILAGKAGKQESGSERIDHEDGRMTLINRIGSEEPELGRLDLLFDERKSIRR